MHSYMLKFMHAYVCVSNKFYMFTQKRVENLMKVSWKTFTKLKIHKCFYPVSLYGYTDSWSICILGDDSITLIIYICIFYFIYYSIYANVNNDKFSNCLLVMIICKSLLLSVLYCDKQRYVTNFKSCYPYIFLMLCPIYFIFKVTVYRKLIIILVKRIPYNNHFYLASF